MNCPIWTAGDFILNLYSQVTLEDRVIRNVNSDVNIMKIENDKIKFLFASSCSVVVYKLKVISFRKIDYKIDLNCRCSIIIPLYICFKWYIVNYHFLHIYYLISILVLNIHFIDSIRFYFNHIEI